MKKLLVLSFGLVAASLAASADEPLTPPAVRRAPIRATAPGAAAEPPGEPPPISELVVPAEEGRVEVRMRNTRIEDALAAYGHLIGKQILCDNLVQGRITVVSDGAVDKEEAMSLLETGVFLNGFSLVDSADGNIVKVIGLGRPARMEGVPIYAAMAELPKRERIVTLLVHLNHADPQQTAGLLSQYIPPSASTGCTPSRSGLLLLTGPTTLVRTMARVVAALDVPNKAEAPGAEKSAPVKAE